MADKKDTSPTKENSPKDTPVTKEAPKDEAMRAPVAPAAPAVEVPQDFRDAHTKAGPFKGSVPMGVVPPAKKE